MGEGSLARQLGKLTCMERRLRTISDDSASGLAISYLQNDRDTTMEDLVYLLLVSSNRSNFGALISLARAISIAHPEFLGLVNGRRFRGLFAQSWVFAFSALPASCTRFTRLEREKAVHDAAVAAGDAESA
jgi:hypothetical protein